MTVELAAHLRSEFESLTTNSKRRRIEKSQEQTALQADSVQPSRTFQDLPGAALIRIGQYLESDRQLVHFAAASRQNYRVVAKNMSTSQQPCWEPNYRRRMRAPQLYGRLFSHGNFDVYKAQALARYGEWLHSSHVGTAIDKAHAAKDTDGYLDSVAALHPLVPYATNTHQAQIVALSCHEFHNENSVHAITSLAPYIYALGSADQRMVIDHANALDSPIDRSLALSAVARASSGLAEQNKSALIKGITTGLTPPMQSSALATVARHYDYYAGADRLKVLEAIRTIRSEATRTAILSRLTCNADYLEADEYGEIINLIKDISRDRYRKEILEFLPMQMRPTHESDIQQLLDLAVECRSRKDRADCLGHLAVLLPSMTHRQRRFFLAALEKIKTPKHLAAAISATLPHCGELSKREQSRLLTITYETQAQVASLHIWSAALRSIGNFRENERNAWFDAAIAAKPQVIHMISIEHLVHTASNLSEAQTRQLFAALDHYRSRHNHQTQNDPLFAPDEPSDAESDDEDEQPVQNAAPGAAWAHVHDLHNIVEPHDEYPSLLRVFAENFESFPVQFQREIARRVFADKWTPGDGDELAKSLARHTDLLTADERGKLLKAVLSSNQSQPKLLELLASRTPLFSETQQHDILDAILPLENSENHPHRFNACSELVDIAEHLAPTARLKYLSALYTDPGLSTLRIYNIEPMKHLDDQDWAIIKPLIETALTATADHPVQHMPLVEQDADLD